MTHSSPHRSFWLQDAAANEAKSAISIKKTPPLQESIRADVTIIGGGYVGLWTSIQIKKIDPGCKVVVIEKDICGGGASGRNGGFALSWWPKISSLVKLCGREQGLEVALDSQRAVEEIETFCIQNNIESQFKKSPWLWTATADSQMGAWESVVELCESLKVDVFRRLSNEEIGRRCGSPVHRAGVMDITAATLHPANLVRGLRKVALELGVEIFEKTEVKSFTRQRPVLIKTAHGQVTSEKLVIANNAWAAGIRELSRSIVAITSDMIMTAPAKSELTAAGWTGGECITDSQMMVDYYHVTQDHRISFGKGGWGIAYGGYLGKDFDRNPKRAQTVEADFRRYYPTLKNVKVTHDWCGPIDRTPNSLPLLGRFKDNENIIYGVGWSGNGVGPSVIGGKILASLALDRSDRWGKYPLIGRSVGKFPPEPIRYLGAHVVRAAVARKEKAEIINQKPSFLALQISKLAPSGLEDKE